MSALFDEAPTTERRKALTLRVLSGPNIGALVRLTPGSYLIGTSAAAEIILQEPSAADPCTVELTLNAAQQVTLTLKEGAAKLSGQSLTLEQATPMAAGELLVIGLSALTFLAEGQSIEQLDLSALGLVAPAPEKSENEANLKEPAESEPPKDESAPPKDEAAPQKEEPLPPQDTMESAALASALEVGEEEKQPKAPRALYLWTALGLILCALALGALVIGSALSDSKAQAAAALASAQEYLTQPDYQEVHVKLDHNMLYFEGTLPSVTSFERFSEELPAFPYGVVLNLEVRDRLLVALEQSAAVYGATIAARYLPNSSAHAPVIGLYGYVLDPYVEANLVSKLKSVLTHTHLAKAQLQPHFSYEPQIRVWLTALRPDALAQVTFNYEDLGLYYEGALTLEQEQALAKLNQGLGQELKLHHDQFKILPRTASHQDMSLMTTEVTAITTASTASGQGIAPKAKEPKVDPMLGFNPDDIVGVTLHPMRFVSMKDGSKFFEGALLPNGYILKTIALEHLVLQKGDEVVNYGLN